MKIKREAYRYDPRVDGISQSILGTWLTCREKARLQVVKGYERTSSSRPFTFGTISHNIKEAAINEFMAGEKMTPDLSDELVESALIIWMNDGKIKTPADHDDASESANILRGLMRAYWNRYGERYAKRKWLFAEKQFKIDIGGVPIVGKMDGGFEHKGKVFLLETKNWSQWPSEINDVLALDLQVDFYTVALDRLYPGKVGGFYYDIIRRPGERKKAGESTKAFASRIYSRACAEPDHFFKEVPNDFDFGRLVRAGARVAKLVAEFVAWYDSLDHAKRDPLYNSHACNGKYGACPMLPICARGDMTYFTKKKRPHGELEDA